MSLRDVEIALGQWVQSNGYTPTVEYDGGPQPAYPYVGLHIDNIATTSNQPEILIADDGVISYREQITICLKVNAYSQNKPNSADTASAAQILELLFLETATVARQQAFLAAGMAFLKRGPTHRMPFQVAGDAWIDRAVLECWFASTRSFTEPLSVPDGLLIAKVRVDPSGPLDEPAFDVEVP